MNRQHEFKLSPLEWVEESLERLQEFPRLVQKRIGDAFVQSGVTPPNAKPMCGIGSGVFEIVQRYQTDTYRTVYATKIGETIYVLHVFQKKSPRGIKTPQKEINLIN